jgi:sulfane dehydrogenase subunit SoxC
MVRHRGVTAGRLVKAPENFLAPQDIREVFAQAREGRRDFIRGAFAAAAASMAHSALATTGDPAILELPAHSKGLGQPVATDGYGRPSKHEANVQRRRSPGLTQTSQASESFAPLQSLFGIVTPSGLHFERHHQGWWDVDPSSHRLIITGSDERIVRRPLVFTMDELMRLPPVSRFHFIECGANTGMEWGNVAVPTVQYTHGMLSCSEFTGVPLKLLLEMAGADAKRGRFVLAEGADGSSMTRTVPMELVDSGEVLVAYGQNGEMLRPENGYPLRLVVPGVQGVSWVKYLRRIEVGDRPYGTKDETLHYVDLMPDGAHRQYTSTQASMRSRLPCSTQSAIAPRTQKRDACAAPPSTRPSNSAPHTTASIAAWGPRGRLMRDGAEDVDWCGAHCARAACGVAVRIRVRPDVKICACRYIRVNECICP